MVSFFVIFKHCVNVIKEIEVLFPIIINFIIAYCASVSAVKLNIGEIEVYVSLGRSLDLSVVSSCCQWILSLDFVENVGSNSKTYLKVIIPGGM